VFVEQQITYMDTEQRQYQNTRKRSTKKESRRKQNNAVNDTTSSQNFNIKLEAVYPKTENQKRVFKEYDKGNHILQHGSAGCGKTFLSLYLSFQDILSKDSQHSKVIIVRSIVPSREPGHLPGDMKQKAAVYEAPYYGICSELFGRGDAYDLLKRKGLIEFTTTSFLRGTTYRDCILIVDEFQNLASHEMNTLMTRVGENCRVIICGDYKQTDFTKDVDKKSAHDLIRIVKRMPQFSTIEFTRDDIVRSAFVKNFIIAKEELNIV